jgi:hypothetical protein
MLIGSNHVDMHLPWWFPGASFKKEAETLAPHIDDMVNKPYQTVKDALVRARSCPFHGHMWLADSGSAQATGVAVPSVAASMIAGLREKPSREDELTSKAVPATMYIGKFLSFHSLELHGLNLCVSL